MIKGSNTKVKIVNLKTVNPKTNISKTSKSKATIKNALDDLMTKYSGNFPTKFKTVGPKIVGPKIVGPKIVGPKTAKTPKIAKLSGGNLSPGTLRVKTVKIPKSVNKSVKPTKNALDPKSGQYKPGSGVDKKGEKYNTRLSKDQINYNLNKQYNDTRKKVEKELIVKPNNSNKPVKSVKPTKKNTPGYDANSAARKKANQAEYEKEVKYYNSKGDHLMLAGSSQKPKSAAIQTPKSAGIQKPNAVQKTILNITKVVDSLVGSRRPKSVKRFKVLR